MLWKGGFFTKWMWTMPSFMVIWMKKFIWAFHLIFTTRGSVLLLPIMVLWFANSTRFFMVWNRPQGSGLPNFLTLCWILFLSNLRHYSFFTYTKGASFTGLLVYVDDILLIGNNPGYITDLKLLLDAKFGLKD